MRAVLAVSPGSCRFRSAWGGIQGWSNPREISRHSPLRDLLRTRRRRRVYLLVVVSSSREHFLTPLLPEKPARWDHPRPPRSPGPLLLPLAIGGRRISRNFDRSDPELKTQFFLMFSDFFKTKRIALFPLFCARACAKKGHNNGSFGK